MDISGRYYNMLLDSLNLNTINDKLEKLKSVVSTNNTSDVLLQINDPPVTISDAISSIEKLIEANHDPDQLHKILDLVLYIEHLWSRIKLNITDNDDSWAESTKTWLNKYGCAHWRTNIRRWKINLSPHPATKKFVDLISCGSIVEITNKIIEELHGEPGLVIDHQSFPWDFDDLAHPELGPCPAGTVISKRRGKIVEIVIKELEKRGYRFTSGFISNCQFTILNPELMCSIKRGNPAISTFDDQFPISTNLS